MMRCYCCLVLLMTRMLMFVRRFLQRRRRPDAIEELLESLLVSSSWIPRGSYDWRKVACYLKCRVHPDEEEAYRE